MVGNSSVKRIVQSTMSFVLRGKVSHTALAMHYSSAIILAAVCLFARPEQPKPSSRNASQLQASRIVLTLLADATGRKYCASLRNEDTRPVFLALELFWATTKKYVQPGLNC